jgi:hypothetical protein
MTQCHSEGRRSNRDEMDSDQSSSNNITPIKEPGRRGGEGEQPWGDPETDPAIQPDPVNPELDEDDEDPDSPRSERRDDENPQK